MNKEIKEFLQSLDEWTLYVQEGNDMPYISLKPDSPVFNILSQVECFDEDDLGQFEHEGHMVFTPSQMTLVNDFFSRVGVAKIEYVPSEWFDVLVKSDYNVEIERVGIVEVEYKPSAFFHRSEDFKEWIK
jgi:hypothetical protein